MDVPRSSLPTPSAPAALPAAGTRHLARLFESALERLGDHPSLCFDGVWHGSGELVQRASRVGAGLRGLGVAPGDRVVVLMANCPEVGVVYDAIWRAGAAVTPVIFLVSAEELRHAIVDARAVALVTTVELLPKALQASEGLPLTLVVAGADRAALDAFGAHPRLVDFAELETAAPEPIVDRADDDLAALLYTGGTTGRSKGVPLSHANLYHAGWASRQVAEVAGVTRSIVALPLSHSYGLLVTVGGLHAGEPGSTVLQRWFDAAGWLELAERHRVQATAVVPSMVAMLLAQPLERYDLSELRYVFSGAAPLPLALVHEMERRVPSVTLLEGYGCTETAGVVSTTPPDRRRVGTVGQAVPGVDIRVVDERGSDVPAGADGEVVVRGPNVMRGYWRDPGTEPVVEPDGWLHTGDIGHLDADGYLTIVDRKKDLIIRGGHNVFPRDVEDVLMQHPGVAGVAVVGRPDPRLGEEVVAFVAGVAGAGLDPQELVAFARQRLSATKYPRDIRVVDAIPLTSVGKVDRKRLRALLAEHAAAAES
jgi:long-chain acyl-CoA synthetase